jgi:antitoxin component YwqK of YwqJK toxin-antitoxin module
MRNILLLLGLMFCLHLNGFSQENEFEMNWQEMFKISDTLYWENGAIRAFNVDSSGDLYRKQYFENGRLELECKFIPDRKIDTIITVNPVTLKDTMFVVKSYSDNLVGDYKSYYQNGNLKAAGLYLNGKKTGRWVYYYENGNKKEIINFDDKGRKIGDYKSYYENGNLKEEGEYVIQIIIKKKRVESKDENYEYFLFDEDMTEIKTGKWEYYKPNGKLKKKVTYKLK